MNQHGTVALGLLVLFVSPIARAQVCQPGELRVLVKDSQEGSIYDAKVRVGSDSEEVATRTTPASGLAEFQQVPCGSWTVKAIKDGFEDSIATVEFKGEPVVEITLTMNPRINQSSLDVTDT